nr:unnamed protein product [Spirometra erinaceieuropaei]
MVARYTLSNATIPDQYLVPHFQNFVGALFSRAVFSKMDLVRAFHQIPLAPEYISKSVVNTSFGLLEFIRMSFGPRNAVQTFQRFNGHVLRGLPFVYTYIVDLLVASQNAGEHKEHLTLVLDHHGKYGVVINPSNCALVCLPLNFLAIMLTQKVCVLFPPRSKPLMIFLYQPLKSAATFYRHGQLLLPVHTEIYQPMLPLTNMPSGPKGSLKLIGDELTAFEKIKAHLADAAFLKQAALEAPLSLMVDASTAAVGAVLQQNLTSST